MLLQKYFESRLELIEHCLKHYLSHDTHTAVELKKAMRHAVFSGGKRWRPLMLVAIYEMLTGFKKHKGSGDAILAGAAVELIHTASMVHDDMPMLTNRNERRNAEALHKKWDNTIAIMSGDALFTLAFEVLGHISNAEKALATTRLLSNYSKSYGMIGGMVVDLEMKRKVMKINTLRYIDMKKVGSLLQASADIACVLADADDNTRQIMNTYALNLGMAYQMIEDVVTDYNRGGDDLDFSEEFVPSSRNSYTSLLGFDKARSQAERLMDEAERMIKPFPKNDVLVEFIQMIQEMMP